MGFITLESTTSLEASKRVLLDRQSVNERMSRKKYDIAHDICGKVIVANRKARKSFLSLINLYERGFAKRACYYKKSVKKN